MEYHEELEARIQEYEKTISDTNWYVSWCQNHIKQTPVSPVLHNIRLLLSGQGKLVVYVQTAEEGG